MDVSTESEFDHVSGCSSVYVANIPLSVDSGQLRELFSSAGKVLHVKLLLDIATGVSRGVAFIMFENIDVANKVCQLMNRTILGGNTLQVRLSERSAVHSCLESHVKTDTVYVRNVPGEVTLKEVQEYCEMNFGPVSNISLHPQSFLHGGPSPYNMVFVRFMNISDACKCVDGLDGKAPFPFPCPDHPFTVAKMISDVNVERRKSIILRARKPSVNMPQARSQVLMPAKQGHPMYLDSTGLNTVYCDAPTQFVAPGHVVSLVLPWQQRENYVALVPQQMNFSEPAFAPQGFMTAAPEPQRILFYQGNGCPMLL